MTRSSRRTSGPGQRRALSGARRAGRVESGGDRDLAARLGAALTDAQHRDPVADSLTHPVHSYPARMHPATARRLVEITLELGPPAGPGPATVLDPFCGSGTVLVEARRRGARAIGVDANPLAILIARAKIWPAPEARRRELVDLCRRVAADAVAEGKAARRAGHEPAPLRRPGHLDARAAQAREVRLARWFAPHVRRELEYIAGRIDELRPRDGELADLATVLLSAILHKVSRRASDTDPTRVDRRVGRGQAARLFGDRAAGLVAGLKELGRDAAGAPPSEARIGDARQLDPAGVAAASVDAAVTSPPYAGTYDYADQHRLRLDFLALPAASFRRSEIGARRQFSDTGATRRRARRRYVRALGGSLAELARVLRPGGHAALMLGDSIAGDRVMWADESLAAAIDGVPLSLVAWASQDRPSLGSKEFQLFASRAKRECIFLLGRDAGPERE